MNSERVDGEIDLTDSTYSMSALFESRKTKTSLLPAPK